MASPNPSQRLGNNLQKWRAKKRLSQGDIAKVLDTDRAYISNIENGRMNPTLFTLEKLSQSLGITVDELLK